MNDTPADLKKARRVKAHYRALFAGGPRWRPLHYLGFTLNFAIGP